MCNDLFCLLQIECLKLLPVKFLFDVSLLIASNPPCPIYVKEIGAVKFTAVT